MSSYKESLQSPRWQRRRLEIMQRADFRCESCGSEDRQLEIHHRRYLTDREPWEYADDDLKCLCCHCHEAHHLPLVCLWKAIEEKEGREPRRKRDDRELHRSAVKSALMDIESGLVNNEFADPSAAFRCRSAIQKFMLFPEAEECRLIMEARKLKRKCAGS